MMVSGSSKLILSFNIGLFKLWYPVVEKAGKIWGSSSLSQ